MPVAEVVRTYLELRGASAFRASPRPAVPVRLERRRPIGATEYRALYVAVGSQWHWRDRLVWSEAELDAYLELPAVHIWTALVAETTAGYFELREGEPGEVEILYFGLVPTFIGQGLGGWLLTRAVEESFLLGARRVLLNTCTLDGPHALPNYLARGFSILREERYTADLPD